MNMKNIFKKMVIILGIIGISATSFAVPSKNPKPKPKAKIVQPKRKTVSKKPAKKQTTNSQGRRDTRKPSVRKK